MNEIHEYWKNPWDGFNLPHTYLDAKEQSRFLAEIIKRYTDDSAKMLEIGCNVGRNLNYLFDDGYKKLSGIEISEEAVRVLKKSFPEMARSIEIHNSPVERIITKFEDNKFDIVFTMAVLEHIHSDSEWIFPEIVRITKNFLITIEDENCIRMATFPKKL